MPTGNNLIILFKCLCIVVLSHFSITRYFQISERCFVIMNLFILYKVTYKEMSYVALIMIILFFYRLR